MYWNSHLPSCFSFRHKFPCFGHNLDLPASCHTQRATWSSLADVHTGSYGTVGWVPSPAGANTQSFQHPTGRGAEEDTREKPQETWDINMTYQLVFFCSFFWSCSHKEYCSPLKIHTMYSTACLKCRRKVPQFQMFSRGNNFSGVKNLLFAFRQSSLIHTWSKKDLWFLVPDLIILRKSLKWINHTCLARSNLLLHENTHLFILHKSLILVNTYSLYQKSRKRSCRRMSCQHRELYTNVEKYRACALSSANVLASVQWTEQVDINRKYMHLTRGDAMLKTSGIVWY